MKSKKFVISIIALCLIACLSVVAFAACDNGEGGGSGEVKDPVTINVVGAWPECRAIEVLATEYKKTHQNVTVTYENIEGDYYSMLRNRLISDTSIDIFFTTSIQKDTDGLTTITSNDLIEYAFDLRSPLLDFSQAFSGLIDNFIYKEDGVASNRQYAVPFGGEMRGMFVNKTLLASVGINEIPGNSTEFLAACETLKQANYIPIHDNPGNFAQLLLYPWICNNIANAADPVAARAAIESRSAAAAETYLRAPYQYLYDLVANDYYDYKTAQNEEGIFTSMGEMPSIEYFLNINNGAPVDNLGKIAFMPAPQSYMANMEKAKSDYHSQIDYVFIPSPIGENGGYAYMSPSHGIAINKNSKDLSEAIDFINYLFQPTPNTLFCENFNALPNSIAALNYISQKYDVPANHISNVGQATFSYDFYALLTEGNPALMQLSKANNPSYMDRTDPSNPVMYSFEYYWNKLLDAFVISE